MVQTEKQPINFFENLDQINELIADKEILVFLDYDGTLTPIVATPDLAIISDEMRQTVQELSSKYKVSIVSGRATDDVKSKVKIDGIFYAGSHGFEISHPDGSVKINEQAQEIRSKIDEVHAGLEQKLKSIEGALVEHVKYTISTHYRLVSDADFPKIKEAVDEVLANNKNLRVTHGKKVFEIRPNIDWHKGKAVEWILKDLEFNQDKNIALYIGDDTTDEDAFAALEGEKGFGILVADPIRASKASYVIKNTDEVKKVLDFFLKRQ